MGKDATRKTANRMAKRCLAIKKMVDAEQAKLDKKVEAAKELHQPKIDIHTADFEAQMAELRQFFIDNFDELVEPGMQTAFLAEVELQMRSSQGAVVIDDEPALIKQLRRMRLLSVAAKKKVTFTPNKAWLKARPEVVDRLKGVRISVKKTLYVKPKPVQGTVARDSIELSIELGST